VNILRFSDLPARLTAGRCNPHRRIAANIAKLPELLHKP
jgi:hypothetical protein